MIAAELARKDADAALAQLAPALEAWPNDAELLYLAGIAHALAGERDARAPSSPALAVGRAHAAARAALGALDAGGAPRCATAPRSCARGATPRRRPPSSTATR